ncbi:MAG: hypothetical protein ACRD3P_18050 [Terriglobales bacterium]
MSNAMWVLKTLPGKLMVQRRLLLTGVGLIALLILAAPIPAFSQSCALCYTQAASSGARMIAALKSGILILVLPPTLGSIGMIFVVYQKRHQVRRGEEGVDSGNKW